MLCFLTNGEHFAKGIQGDSGKKVNKVQTKVLFLLLASVVCLAFSKSITSQSQEPWQKDWLKFGEAIAPYAREGTLESKHKVLEFNRMFSKKVEWVGTLRSFYSNEVAKTLRLQMQPIQIPLRDGSVIEASELSISCAVKESGCEGWSAELVGKEVVFRTELMNRTRGILPVVKVEDWGEEEGQRIKIETYGAELVRIISK